MQNDNNTPENKDELSSEADSSDTTPETQQNHQTTEQESTTPETETRESAETETRESAETETPESAENKTQVPLPQDEQPPAMDSVVNLSDAAQIRNPFHAIQAMILKPNRVFARIKNTENWSWIPFLFVVALAALPSMLYFNTVDMDWYIKTMVDLHYGDVSPAEKQQATHFMMQQQESLAALTVTIIIIWIAILNAIFALYLYKMTQSDPDNVMSYGDWYGFTWWAALPMGFVSILSLLIILVFGHPELMPDYLAPLSLAFVVGLPINSDWYPLLQTVSLEVFWAVYLTAVGVSQWTKLPTKQCYIIAIAPIAIIWGVRAIYTIM